MRYYLAYKFRGADKDEIKDYLQRAAEVIEAAGDESYSYFGDVVEWKIVEKPPGEAIEKGFKEVKNSDAVIAIITQDEKSAGMLLELGYARALNKKIIVAIKEGLQVPTLEAISDENFFFSSKVDFQKKLRSII